MKSKRIAIVVGFRSRELISAPLAGSTRHRCQGCGDKIWLTVESVALVKSGGRPLCRGCAVDLAEQWKGNGLPLKSAPREDN